MTKNKISGNTARLLDLLKKKFDEKEGFIISNQEISDSLN